MTPRRFHWLLATTGPDLSAWSAANRAAALLLLRTDPAARTALADAMAAEDGGVPGPAASPGPPDQAALLRMQAAIRRALAPPPPVLRGIRAGALAACVAIGLYLGLRPGDADTAPLAAAGIVSSVDASLDGNVSATVLAALDP